jgi:two-component system cell cycle response regulator CtrA
MLQTRFSRLSAVCCNLPGRAAQFALHFAAPAGAARAIDDWLTSLFWHPSRSQEFATESHALTTVALALLLRLFRHRPATGAKNERSRRMRILLAGMECFVAGDIAVVLAGQSFTMERADDHDIALEFARRYHFDVVLFGAGHGGTTGAAFIRQLRATGAQVPAVAVARALEGRGRGRLLDAGADDVIDLPCDTGEMCARLRAVVRRSRGFTRSVLSVGPLELHMDSRAARVDNRDIHLSPSEYKVLELLVLRRGVVVTKNALMDLLYGEFDEPDVRSLNVLMHRLRKRLASVGLGAFVRTVWGTGYLVEEPTRRPNPPLGLPGGNVLFAD